MRCYKLTNQHLQTYAEFQWELGKWYKVSGKGPLCSDGWFHAYEHPLLAVLFNPIHANLAMPRLFEASYDGRCRHRQRQYRMKIGVQRLRLDREISRPYISTAALYGFHVMCLHRQGCLNRASSRGFANDGEWTIAKRAAVSAEYLASMLSLYSIPADWLEMIETAITKAKQNEDWTPRYELGVSGYKHRMTLDDESRQYRFVRPKDGIVPVS